MSWETVIGLEVHVQLKTRSKLFCGCSANFGDPPNTNVCPVCLGLPGTLPRPNEQAIRLAVRAALALGCEVHALSVFARKHYFYPDLPKGYQISQFEQPLATRGHLDIGPAEVPRPVGVMRLHLEEDAGKSLHDRFGGLTAIDYNRCGVPLIEIVSEPDLASPEEARRYLTVLKQVLEYLDVSDCNMEEGSLRVDANLSVRRPGAALGVKQEVKNMNSFAGVEGALEGLRERQIAALELGDRITLTTYTARTGELAPMRAKEESHDYRYFPEPDLPPLALARFGIDVDEVSRGLPELPRERQGRFERDYGLSAYEAAVLTSTLGVADYFEAVAQAGAPAKDAAHWVMGPVLADASRHERALRASPPRVAEIIALVSGGALSMQAAKRVFAEIAERDQAPAQVAERMGVVQVRDVAELNVWVSAVLERHAVEVRRYREGEERLLPFFVGEVMKVSRGRADPRAAQDLLRDRLAQRA